ncbi:MAG TPA: methylated-DNA--[protein]-cysteine S-methyltransferase [Rhodopila sp.]
MNDTYTGTSSRLHRLGKTGTIPTNSIAFAIGQTALGEVLVARGAMGVCAILIGSDAEELRRDLAARFPADNLVADRSLLRDDLSKAARFIEDPEAGLDLLLDMGGTPFQRRVWNVLRTIPAGATVTYAEVARRIGEPRSFRAVARACASNPIALAVPCHRVVGSNGALSGYRWGIERKRALIDREAAA